jgi:hypothetical protein
MKRRDGDRREEVGKQLVETIRHLIRLGLLA